jgi:hypothetical protein
MFSTVRKHLTYANVMATTAVFLALGGISYAAVRLPAKSVGARQLKRNAVTSPKVKNGSLFSSDFRAGQLPAGAKGATGDTGPRGPEGPPGIDDDIRVVGSSASDPSDSKFAHAECPDGTVVLGGGYVVNVTSTADKPSIVVSENDDQGTRAFPDGGGWIAQAYETTPVAVDWSLEVDAICG